MPSLSSESLEKRSSPYRIRLRTLAWMPCKRYNLVMAIHSFRDTATEDLFDGRKTSRVRRFPPDLMRIALRKLDVLNGAHRLNDLKSPPANRLEALKGDLVGFHSIRVNDQWRLIFRWEDGVHDVSLTDYH